MDEERRQCGCRQDQDEGAGRGHRGPPVAVSGGDGREAGARGFRNTPQEYGRLRGPGPCGAGHGRLPRRRYAKTGGPTAHTATATLTRAGGRDDQAYAVGRNAAGSRRRFPPPDPAAGFRRW
ncbi:hypothetical protein GCM10010327_34900 [Streptomyces nitrosporeus]|nr:hypothetical protein GCM10010327_34900 [Streptomyces nitrosporeus]